MLSLFERILNTFDVLRSLFFDEILDLNLEPIKKITENVFGIVLIPWLLLC